MAVLPFCDLCGRELDPGARFCDLCGRRTALVEEVPRGHQIVPSQVAPPPVAVLRPPTPETVGAARDASPRKSKGLEAAKESKPAERRMPPEPRQARRRLIPAGGFHVRRKVLVLSVAVVVVVATVALAFLKGPTLLPVLLPSTLTQTSSQTATTYETGPPLKVRINIARNPVSAGSTQVVIVTVTDPNGNAISNASVRIEVLYSSGHREISEGLTGAEGMYNYAWHIMALAENVGTFQVSVSATKAGYQTGQAQASFEVTAT